MNDEAEVNAAYADFFRGQATRYYDAAGNVKSEAIELAQFQDPWGVLNVGLKDPYSASMQTIARSRETYMPVIEDFLSANGVIGLDFYAQGGTATTFEVKTSDVFSKRSIFRTGLQVSRRYKTRFTKSPLTAFNRPWCPLVLQPAARIVLALRQSHGGYDAYRVGLERLPLLPVMAKNDPESFGSFLNAYILVGTPYKVADNKDLGIMSDGTPVYVDPDSLNFTTSALARQHAKDQFDPAWQQEIMAIIDANSRVAAMPEPLRWVVLQEDGRFATKQAALYGNVVPLRPQRTFMRLRAPSSDL